jgi:hypothetical protein
MSGKSVAAIVIGALLLLLGVITLIPWTIDRLFELLSSPHFRFLWGPRFLTFGGPESAWKWSRRLAHIWMPAMSFLVGIALILQGAGVFE